ncbi:MAG: tRNA epoxyqueuosine(34) reductase QueG [Mariprofundaceae bacterium]|nr:tRNA epoxyqueuosine(34) reductase QueG [Mariprofundaceae bacterium]
MNELAALIRQHAKEHGFDACYFSRPIIKNQDKEALNHWLEHDYQADMTWMAEETRLERRKDPKSMLDGVQTVICLAMRHTPPAYDLETAQASKEQGIIASYAYGLDYHDVMKKRLKALAHDLDDLLGKHAQRVYVDTAPVLEHALAASAGLGWQGKHSLTIHREHGSYLMLGEIFTTAYIEENQAASQHCGSCTACLDVCPTRAIVAPYVVDANLCISYLTIEYKGVIPRHLRTMMGNHIYGCDDCQMVCPWNRKITPVDDLLMANQTHIRPMLSTLLLFNDDDFRQHFRKSPVKRTGRVALLRNVCVAMGNSGCPDFIPSLLQASKADESLIRIHAIWALSQLINEPAHVLQQLNDLEKDESDDDVLQEIAQCRQEAIASAA